MSEEKQIKEMADTIYTFLHTDTMSRALASLLYGEGFCKKSEGEWRSELVKKCDWKGKKHDYYQPNSCSLCHEAVLKRTPFCPNCGAKMKGGE